MIQNIFYNYEIWIHFFTAVILLLILIYFMWKMCVNSFVQTVDNSKYAYLIIKWILKNRGQEISPEAERKFINVRDMQAILNMQKFIDTVKAASLEPCKYKDLKHPFFVWHDVVFCRTKGNDIVRVDNGQLGKIPEDEMVDGIIISDNFSRVLCAIDYALRMEKHFKDVKDGEEHKPDTD